MDFGELLHTAKKNEKSKPQVQYYSTKFAPPKKELRTKSLSVNIQKFLARKEAEEKEKQKDANERKNKLLALRSQDKKATRRVNVMLKRTKSANQAVIADALDSDNTAVTLAGPSQPDEDDYGYVSQESSALYIKMMEKYSKMPDEPKFLTEKKKVSTNLSSTKDRVKAALEREKEEALLPHRRKRKHVENKEDNDKIEETEVEKEPEKKDIPKPKFKAAPALNFSDLLKLAEKKQFEPVVIETKKEEEERPLTKKQKKEVEREKQWKERKESQNKISQEKLMRIPKLHDSKVPSMQKIPGTNSENSRVPPNNIKSIVSDKVPNRPMKVDVNRERQQSSNKSVNKSLDSVTKINQQATGFSKKHLLNEKMADGTHSNDVPFVKPKPPLQNQKTQGDMLKISQQKKNVPNKANLPLQDTIKNKEILSHSLKAKQFSSNKHKSDQPPSNNFKSNQPPSNNFKSNQSPSNNFKSNRPPSNNFKPKPSLSKDIQSKQLPPVEVRRNPLLKGNQRKPLVNKRRIIDDEEYDSEMDDFIDDGPEENNDYSKYISEIFGYDKGRYRYDDDDVDDMESSFAQQMREEVISTKIGIMEDLEDMRQEEEAKKKKLLMTKRRKL